MFVTKYSRRLNNEQLCCCTTLFRKYVVYVIYGKLFIFYGQQRRKYKILGVTRTKNELRIYNKDLDVLKQIPSPPKLE